MGSHFITYFRLAFAQFELEMYEESMASIKKAKGYEPSNVDITLLYQKVSYDIIGARELSLLALNMHMLLARE